MSSKDMSFDGVHQPPVVSGSGKRYDPTGGWFGELGASDSA